MGRLACALVALGCLLVVGAGTATATDPRVGEQDWLARVVPQGMVPPSPDRIPPIAIIEDGVDPGHPDMAGGWVTVRRTTPRPDPADTGRVMAYRAGIAHGTSVAAIIGAPRDGVGIEGILPGARVWVYGGNGTCRDTAAAIRRAVDNGARIINASYGFDWVQACREHHDATSYAFGMRALVVAAAGNERNSNVRSQPANDLHVLTVAALNAFDQPTGFSNQNLYTDIAASGEGVFTAVPVWADTDDGAQDGYARIDGTSFATPMVAAAAAWIMAERPRLSADQVAEVLRRSSRDLIRPGWDSATGWGALDLSAALSAPAPAHDPLEPNDDIRWVSGRALFSADTPFLRRTRAAAIGARLDVQKDPVDVYPVWVPPGAAVRARMVPRLIRADLYLRQPDARRAYGGRLADKSTRPGLAAEQVVATNYGRRPLTAWIEVRSARGASLSGSYRLTMSRSR